MKNLKTMLTTMLCMLFCITASAQSTPFKGAEVAEGNYFFYNVGTGKWLDNNSIDRGAWTSRAQLTNYGMDFGVIINGDGWQINPKMGNNHSLNGDNLYMDTGDAVTKWDFTPSNDGVSNGYIISFNGQKLGSRENGIIQENANLNTTWQIVTAEERLAYMAQAVETAPVDASWLISGREFPVADERISSWNLGSLSSYNPTNGDGGADYFVRCNRVFEAWNLENCNIEQTLNVPNGVYTLYAHAIYSPTAGNDTNADDYANYKENGEETVHGYIFANGESVKMNSIYNGKDASQWGYAKTIVENECYIPANIHEASYAIFFGGYKTEVVRVVVTDGKLTIGARVENGGGSAWILLDKFTLTYESSISGLHEVQEGKYYLYNIETGKWLGGNTEQATDYHTRVQLNASGLDFNLVKNGEGWSLDPTYNCDGNIDTNDAYLDHYGDNVKAPWTLTEQAVDGYAHAYVISSPNITFGINETTQLLTYNQTAEKTAHFILVTPEEREAIMLQGTEETPTDASWLIRGYDLSAGTPRVDAWSLTADGNNIGSAWCNTIKGQSREVWRWNVINFSQNVKLPNGHYRLYTHSCYVPTEGNAMNESDLNDYLNRGAETVFAELYAGPDAVKVPSIYSAAKAEGKTDGFNKEIAGYGLPNGVAEITRDFFRGYDNEEWVEGYYLSEPLEFTVTNGEIEIGIRNTFGAPNSSWIIIGDFKLEFIGELSGVDAYRDELVKAIAAAEEYMNGDVPTTTVLLIALNEAMMEGQELIDNECNDAEQLAAATTAINTALANCKAVNLTDLYALIEWLFENEAYLVYADECYTNGEECAFITAYTLAETGTRQSEIDAAVKALKLDYKWFVASKSEMPAEWTEISQSVVGTDDNEPATNGKYYAYNVGTGRWFCGGDDWGAHAAVGFPGIEFELGTDNYGSGHYNNLTTFLFNGNWGQSGKLNNGGYCDTGGNAWKFWKQDAENGIYTWSNNGDSSGNNTSNGYGTKDLVGFNTDTYMRVDVHREGADNPYNQWVFVTKAQRLAALENATVENPVDATFMIGMPGFNQRERTEGSNQNGDENLFWVCNHENYTYDNTKYDYGNLNGGPRHIIFERGLNHADFCVDVEGAQYGEEFSLSQTVKNLPAGFYGVKVQGYAKGAQQEEVFFNANNEKVVLRAMESDILIPWNNSGNYPDNTWQAIEAFQNGLYWNELVAEVTEDGELTISVTKETAGNDYAILFDNFRLVYYGTTNPTGVTEVNATEKVGNAVYTISGVRVDGTLSKGLYIINGKKKVVK